MKRGILLIAGLFLIVLFFKNANANEFVNIQLPINILEEDPRPNHENCFSLLETEQTSSTHLEIDTFCILFREDTSSGALNEITKVFFVDINLNLNGKNFSTTGLETSYMSYDGGFSLTNVLNSGGTTTVFTNLMNEDGSFFIGKITIRLQNLPEHWGDVAIDGVLIENMEERISALESWKQTIDEWKIDVTNWFNNLFSTTTDHETRIDALEETNNGDGSGGGGGGMNNLSLESYWKYLGNGDKKNIVCGVAIDNHLDTLTMEELNYKCDVTYRQTSRGEKATCKCKKL